jgi:hypothetical protein
LLLNKKENSGQISNKKRGCLKTYEQISKNFHRRDDWLSNIFLVVSMFTGKWGFFLWSLPPSFISGMTGFFASKHANRNTYN